MKGENHYVLAILYGICAISGALGGCAAASTYFTHDKNPKIAFALAYVMLGIVFGVLGLAAMLVYGVDLADISKAILYAGMAGAFGSTALAGANVGARMYFKKLGIEVQLTVRKPEEERRSVDNELQE